MYARHHDITLSMHDVIKQEWAMTSAQTLVQYNTIQYNTIQYNTIQYNTIQYNTIQYNTSTSISISTSIFVKSVKSFRISHQLFITIPILKIYIYNNIYCY
jgi:hypothetical protein